MELKIRYCRNCYANLRIFKMSKLKKMRLIFSIVPAAFLLIGCTHSKDFDCEGVGLRIKGDSLYFGAGDYKLCEKYELFSVYKLIGKSSESKEITCSSNIQNINFYQITNKITVKNHLLDHPEDQMSCIAK